MFENEPSTTPPPTAPPSPALPPQDIHTMPERFMDTGAGGAAPRPTGGRGKKLLMVGISAVVLGGLGAGAWYYFTRLSSETAANANVTANANTNANVNRNANLNRNLNANANANLNANVNSNANLNLNANANVNQNANVNVNTNANTNTSTAGTPLPLSTDTDSDGLTDTEEAVYSTQTNSNDTDGDGFIDGMRTLANGKIEGEVYSGYCPTKTGSVRLDADACALMQTYTNTAFNYALWVPTKWLSQPTSSDQKTVIITPDIATTEFFQVSVLDNPTQVTAKNYYLSLNPGIDPTKLKDATVNGLDGVLSLDESTVYFVKGTKIYIVSYNTNALSKVNLRTTFTAMYRSFHLVAPTTTNTNTNVNSNTNTAFNTNG
ncbi:MAG: hypothetical protein HY421_00855 [Candidatus Kerfeldbacteria bacterium]|nr:hypothetical protein [Candidatus Kerfeldbacteria bacterium]